MRQNIRSSLFLAFLFFLSTSLFAQKKVLDHNAYDQWNFISGIQVSDDGDWSAYVVAPQRKDGMLYRQNLPDGQAEGIARGTNPVFTGSASFMAFKIRPPFDSTRNAKIAKVKPDKMPKDSMGIWKANGELEKLERVKSFALGKERGEWLAIHLEKFIAPKDTAQRDSSVEKPKSPKARKGKKGTSPLLLYNPIENRRDTVNEVKGYAISDYGNHIAYFTAFGDSIDSTAVRVFVTATQEYQTLYEGPGYTKGLVFDKEGEQLAFLMSTDTGEVKTYQLYLWAGEEAASLLVSAETEGMPEGWTVSEHGDLLFSESGKRLYLGTAPAPYEVPEDSLPEDEIVKLDIWTWHDTRLQPQQLKELKEDKKENFLAVVHLDDKRFVQLADETVHRVRTSLKGDGQFAIGTDRKKYEKLSSWEAPSSQDVYLVDVNTGKKELILPKKQHSVSLSAGGKFILYYDAEERVWYSYENATQKKRALTSKLKVNFFNEDHDTPMLPYPYQVAGWTEGDETVLIQDRYDFWQIDPTMAEKPVNISKGFGRKNNIRLTYEKLDQDRIFVEKEMLLRGFDEDDKSYGVYRMRLGTTDIPEKLVHSDHQYSNFMKAKNADRLMWRRQSFVEYADLWTGDMQMENAVKLSDANPQQADYNWGTVEYMSWKDGKEKGEALLVKPEDFDPNKKYPLIVYFYELSSRRKNTYYPPSPSRSTVNWSMYASNGYLVLVPDIHYQTGQPGQDALIAVDKAVGQLIESCGCVDEEKMGLQGQSWGGYQIAYMVTQTNRYAAAMAGAPVSNMTSAYGGIRWGSGRSRMFQYERTQSRLGTTLWEDRDRYINNSPIFFAPQVETPLLMMHNDDDGAVPWYQGIEYFVSLRRLNKPVWMLVYNGEQHNLTKWPNRVDLSIRMQQFFDHYLKGKPAPRWMTEGLPAVKKGEELRYD